MSQSDLDEDLEALEQKRKALEAELAEIKEKIKERTIENQVVLRNFIPVPPPLRLKKKSG